MCFVFDQVVDFVDSQYETYLDGEARVNRRPISDTRVHACLYFIAPSGHGLKVSIWKDILNLVYWIYHIPAMANPVYRGILLHGKAFIFAQETFFEKN